MTKRNPSLLTLITKIAERGLAARVTLPDGTILEVGQNGSKITSEPPIIDIERAAADEAFRVAFG